ncbi:unnamed protein product, partial [Menidia menidia]
MPANSVSAVCGENAVRVEVQRDLLGVGKPVLETDVSLGGCPPTGEDPEQEVLIFESELHQCGSQLLMTEDSFIYVFTLLYTPSPLGDGSIVRGRDVSVSIQCHYQRFEASVRQFHHVPLRVTVDSCVATVVPNVDT